MRDEFQAQARANGFTVAYEPAMRYPEVPPDVPPVELAGERLAQAADAHRLLDWFLGDQRPQGWNHWAEVVFKDPLLPKFIGDMPHGWVASDFIRAVLPEATVERTQHMVEGARRCAYEVRPR